MSKTQGLGSITKQKRAKGWYYTAVISLGYDQNGTQIKRTKSSYKLKEVNAWIRENSNKVFTPDSEKTLSEVTAEYLVNFKKPKVSKLTYEKYESRFRLYIKAKPLGDMKIKDISRAQVQSYANDLVKTESIDIAHFMIMLIKAVTRKLSDDGAIEKNPCADISLPPKKAKPRSYLRDEEQKIILGSLDLNDKRDLAIYMTMCTGLRLGEIMALKWIDIKNGTVLIDKQFARVEKSKFDIKCTKTDTSIREVPLPDIASKIIEKFRDGTGYIFSDNGEKPFDRKRVQRRYKQICKENNIESTFHSLRHTFATNMVSANVNLAVLKDLLGHKSLDTTMIYSHITQKAKQESVDKIADKLDIKTVNIL